MNEAPNYYAIIPANVRYDSRLKANEKLLYGEITALSQKEGYCYATNRYFADLYSVSFETVSRWVSKLSKLGYISITMEYKPGTKEIESRKIYLLTFSSRGIDEKIKGGIDKKVKDNNTSINIYTSFDEFWSSYPRKVGKAAAKKSFDKHKLYERKDLVAIIEAHKEQWTDSKFIPHPTTWINQGRYDDEIEVYKPKAKFGGL